MRGWHLDGDQPEHLSALRRAHRRRLRILEQQAAVSGIHTRPDVLTEIEDIQQALAQLDAQLAAAVEAQSVPVATPAHPAPAEPRRTQTTILSAGLVGVSALFDMLDPEDAVEIVDDLWRRLDTVVAEYGGVVDRRADDTALALWGVQATREDDPERAIRVALALQALMANIQAAQQLALTLRIGISTGLVLLGPLGAATAPSPVGGAVNLAGQLQRNAPDGGILLAHDTYRHVRGLFAVEARGQLARAGNVETMPTYLVQAAKPRAFHLGSRGVEGLETRMVGRDAELRRLQETFETVSEDSELHVITIVGEAGVGKSRLLHAFRSWEELQAQQAWLFAGRATQDMLLRPYALLRDLFAFRFAILDNDPPAVAREKLERGITTVLGAVDLEGVMKAQIIGQLLGLDFVSSPHLHRLRDDPKQLHDRALHYLSQFIGALTRTGPLLLVLEDLHWADDASLDALAVLMHNSRTLPVLALCLARPTLFERRPAWGEGEQGQTRLTLEPLSKRASRQLVEEILRRVPDVPAALRDQIVMAAEGNPFYVEELIKMLIDEGAIMPGPEVWQVKAARLETLHVPATLTGVLQARLDSLEPSERGSLERASVIGRIFWDNAVAHLGDGNAVEGVRALLDGLRRRELVFRHEVSAFAGANEYLFKHMLLREVTYERVLKRQRRSYHAQAAAWLITASGKRVDEYAGLIAEHYEQAGDVAQAAEWHERAGRRAQAAYANAEAIAHYERALVALPEDRRGGMLLAMGQVLELIGQWDAAETRLRAALTLAEAAQDAAAQWQCQQALGRLLIKRGDYPQAREWLQVARRGALARGDREGEATTLWALGLLSRQLGDYAQAWALHGEGLAISRELGDRWGIAAALANLGTVADEQGDYAQARALIQESLTLSRELSDKRFIAITLGNLGNVATNLGDYVQARGLYEESLALRRELGDKQLVTSALGNLGGLAANLGDYAQARALFEESLALSRELRDRRAIAWMLGNLGSMSHEQGNHDQARVLLQESLALVREQEDKLGVAHILAGLAASAAATGDLERAVRLAGATDTLLQAIGAVLAAVERGFCDTAVNTARDQLDATMFDALWAEGQAMTLEHAIEYALEE